MHTYTTLHTPNSAESRLQILEHGRLTCTCSCSATTITIGVDAQSCPRGIVCDPRLRHALHGLEAEDGVGGAGAEEEVLLVHLPAVAALLQQRSLQQRKRVRFLLHSLLHSRATAAPQQTLCWTYTFQNTAPSRRIRHGYMGNCLVFGTKREPRIRFS